MRNLKVLAIALLALSALVAGVAGGQVSDEMNFVRLPNGVLFYEVLDPGIQAGCVAVLDNPDESEEARTLRRSVLQLLFDPAAGRFADIGGLNDRYLSHEYQFIRDKPATIFCQALQSDTLGPWLSAVRAGWDMLARKEMSEREILFALSGAQTDEAFTHLGSSIGHAIIGVLEDIHGRLDVGSLPWVTPAPDQIADWLRRNAGPDKAVLLLPSFGGKAQEQAERFFGDLPGIAPYFYPFEEGVTEIDRAFGDSPSIALYWSVPDYCDGRNHLAFRVVATQLAEHLKHALEKSLARSPVDTGGASPDGRYHWMLVLELEKGQDPRRVLANIKKAWKRPFESFITGSEWTDPLSVDEERYTTLVNAVRVDQANIQSSVFAPLDVVHQWCTQPAWAEPSQGRFVNVLANPPAFADMTDALEKAAETVKTPFARLVIPVEPHTREPVPATETALPKRPETAVVEGPAGPIVLVREEKTTKYFNLVVDLDYRDKAGLARTALLYLQRSFEETKFSSPQFRPHPPSVHLSGGSVMGGNVPPFDDPAWESDGESFFRVLFSPSFEGVEVDAAAVIRQNCSRDPLGNAADALATAALGIPYFDVSELPAYALENAYLRAEKVLIIGAGNDLSRAKQVVEKALAGFDKVPVKERQMQAFAPQFHSAHSRRILVLPVSEYGNLVAVRSVGFVSVWPGNGVSRTVANETIGGDYGLLRSAIENGPYSSCGVRPGAFMVDAPDGDSFALAQAGTTTARVVETVRALTTIGGTAEVEPAVNRAFRFLRQQETLRPGKPWEYIWMLRDDARQAIVNGSNVTDAFRSFPASLATASVENAVGIVKDSLATFGALQPTVVLVGGLTAEDLAPLKSDGWEIVMLPAEAFEAALSGASVLKYLPQ